MNKRQKKKLYKRKADENPPRGMSFKSAEYQLIAVIGWVANPQPVYLDEYGNWFTEKSDIRKLENFNSIMARRRLARRRRAKHERRW